ncbi:MAG TPA: DUF6404 family protein [Luteimonas sp.]|nr:DUF6404 family protein [Luteimonas sp.]
MAYEWRREAWRQRLRILAMIVGMAAIFCVVDTLQDGEMLSTMFSRRGWPLLMPVLIYCGGLLVTGLGPRKVGIDCRVLGLLEGDRSVIERYPPLIQAGLLRAFKAGADERTLLPLMHGVFWRLRVPVPPVAFSPAWLNALMFFLASYLTVPLWLHVQDRWDPGIGGGSMGETGNVVMVLLGVFALVEAAHQAGERRALNLPGWCEFRRSWVEDTNP